jgi:hypothetical protein
LTCGIYVDINPIRQGQRPACDAPNNIVGSEQ